RRGNQGRQKECPPLPIVQRPRGDEDDGEEPDGAENRGADGAKVEILHHPDVGVLPILGRTCAISPPEKILFPTTFSPAKMRIIPGRKWQSTRSGMWRAIGIGGR